MFCFQKIHQIIMSLNFTGIEIKTINALDSWTGGVLVVVTGSVKSRDFIGRRNFVQTFFLAPQEKGYFVLNDMFHFADEEEMHQPSVLVAQEQHVDYQSAISTHLPDPPVSDYPLHEESGNYVNSVYIEGDEPIQEYSYQEHEQPELEPELELEAEPEPLPAPEPEAEILEEEIPFEESNVLLQSKVTAMQETQPSTEEPVGEPEKLTYASILRAKGKSSSSFSSPPPTTWSTPPAADWHQVSQPSVKQSAPSPPSSRVDAVEELLSLEQGGSKSVYVRNLPSTVTSLDIAQEFKSFGKIKSDGVFLKNRQDTGVCFAFVEFEDVHSVENAIKASPIELAGRKVYIEERRPNSVASRGGRSGGRGRGGRGGRSFGRGSDQNGTDNNRVRSNGLHGF
ncbi:hypothetical protein BUALT_Bualt02G0199400 [Buddleja alternifolia]|uniref:G3BP-like protein n=1 Tax=Buddleja alternifolia TaxID=168488 RepID=A0AAV6Y9P5_9LAMI|nr:hypothetical protein BUALT_Bualt02G0199400 [Buddleja alternifolia]